MENIDSLRGCRTSPDGALTASGIAGNALASVTRNALTIDVEDYFQVEAFAGIINRGDWERYPARVERNTGILLDLLAEARVSATLFTLGWVAQRFPQIVRRITAEGHELASHGTDHCRVDQQSAEEFRADIRRAKAVLEDIGGTRVLGYRAPTFSINTRSDWAYPILMEEGYRYSSSVYPIHHDVYGQADAPRVPFSPYPGLIEIPLTTVRLFGCNLPTAGGGYFRLLPYAVTRRALRTARQQSQSPCVFYLHPWEIDPDQPRQAQAPRLSRFRHYLNLGRTEGRLRRLLGDFDWTRIDRVFFDEAVKPSAASP
jgi:polysaccharide deacetylase family protein (PEP-CTERM system associated)